MVINTSTGRPGGGASPAADDTDDADDVWDLKLYIAGQTPKCIAALHNLKRFCEEHLVGRYRIEVVDLIHNPGLAKNDQILAIPTLIRRSPEPKKKIIGDLSNTERVLVGLDVRPQQRAEMK